MAGLQYDGIPSTQTDSSTFSGTSALGTTGSFTNIRGTLTSTDGAVYSAGVGSPITYGAIVQAGTAGPLLGATGSIKFGRQFTNASFIVTITPQVSGTLYPYVVSGTTTYTVSGITYGAQSGLSYNWVAVGVV